jgi:hypothetical protein
MRGRFGLCLWLPLVLGVGCTYTDKMPLPVDTVIAETKMKSDRPKLFLDEMSDWTAMPLMVPYLLLSVTHDKMTPRKNVARRLWYKAEDEGADVVRILPPVLNPPNLRTTAICYRWLSCRLGFIADDAGFVLEAGSARGAGILEGDRVISVSGARFETGHDAKNYGFYNAMWRLKAGDAVELVWIRPGVGKMKASLACEPNDSSYLTVKDSLEWEPRPVY